MPKRCWFSAHEVTNPWDDRLYFESINKDATYGYDDDDEMSE